VAPDLPAGTRAARDLLLKDPVRLTEADRDSLHRFFRERIEQAIKLRQRGLPMACVLAGPPVVAAVHRPMTIRRVDHRRL